VSGGRTPLRMLERLAAQDLPWASLDLFQVDERVAPAGHVDRNATTVERAFEARITVHPERFHFMPVEDADLKAGARRYAATLRSVLGPAACLDAVHLGLGADGHTASLFPGSPLLEGIDADVAVTPAHAGRVRMTLTLAALNRARRIVWLVTGRDKRGVLERLVARDPELVASRIRRDGAVVVADVAARG
jgi:6-phosphogluconolactonase